MPIEIVCSRLLLMNNPSNLRSSWRYQKKTTSSQTRLIVHSIFSNTSEWSLDTFTTAEVHVTRESSLEVQNRLQRPRFGEANGVKKVDKVNSINVEVYGFTTLQAM